MHIEWWQALVAIAFVVSTLDRGVVILEHLGLLPRQALGWLQQRWLRRLEDQARRSALDALLTNGITSKLDAVRAQGIETVELVADQTVKLSALAKVVDEHLVDAVEDRRLAVEDRALAAQDRALAVEHRERLDAVYGRLIGKDDA